MVKQITKAFHVLRHHKTRAKQSGLCMTFLSTSGGLPRAEISEATALEQAISHNVRVIVIASLNDGIAADIGAAYESAAPPTSRRPVRFQKVCAGIPTNRRDSSRVTPQYLPTVSAVNSWREIRKQLADVSWRVGLFSPAYPIVLVSHLS